MFSRIIVVIFFTLSLGLFGHSIYKSNFISDANQTYTLATDKDFEVINEGLGTEYYIYIGNEPYVEIPHVINGKNVRTNYNMFSESKNNLRGVKSTNKNVTNMTSMFIGAKSTNLDLSQLDTSGAINMSSMFSGSKAAKLDLSNFNTSKATNMGNMFLNSSATEINVSNFDTSKVTHMNSMFNGSNAEGLDLSNFNTSNTTNMNNMFKNSKAKTIKLNNFDTSNVTLMEGMFYGSRATSLDLRNFDTSKVTIMRDMFNDTQVNKLDLSSFDTRQVTSMRGMFHNSEASELNLTSFNTSNVTVMNDMFNNSKANKLNLTNLDTSKVTNMSGMFNNSNISKLDLTNFDTSKVTNMSDMFHNSKANEINVSNFDTSKVTSMGDLFRGTAMTELNLSSFNTSKVTNMGAMFRESSVKELDLSSFDTSNVVYMNSMFNNSLVENIDLSSFDTTNVMNMVSMFNRTKLKTIDLRKFDISNDIDLTDMFKNSEATIGYAKDSASSDRLNNSSGKPRDLTFFPYGTPFITLSQNGSSSYNKSYSVSANVDAQGVGIKDVKYLISSSRTFPTGGDWTNIKPGNKIIIGTYSGTYYLHIKATSDNGQTSEFSSNGFLLDNTGPSLNYDDSDSKKFSLDDEGRIRFNLSDDYSGVNESFNYELTNLTTGKVTSDNDTLINGSGFVVIPKTVGLYKLSITGTDTLGNTSTRYINNISRSGSLFISKHSSRITFEDVRLDGLATKTSETNNISVEINDERIEPGWQLNVGITQLSKGPDNKLETYIVNDGNHNQTLNTSSTKFGKQSVDFRLRTEVPVTSLIGTYEMVVTYTLSDGPT